MLRQTWRQHPVPGCQTGTTAIIDIIKLLGSMKVQGFFFYHTNLLERANNYKHRMQQLSIPLRATRSVFVSKPLLFRSRVVEVSAREALGHTIAHKVGHSSGIKHAKRKVETCGPAPIVVELEQTLYTV